MLRLIELLIYLMPGLIIGIGLLIYAIIQKPRTCPKCKHIFPKIRTPRNMSQAIWGGWTCKKCGCETDREGKEIKNTKKYVAQNKKILTKAIIITLVLTTILIAATIFAFDYYVKPYKYTNNMGRCELFNEGSILKDQCYYEFALKTNDQELCSKLEEDALFDRYNCIIKINNQINAHKQENTLLINTK